MTLKRYSADCDFSTSCGTKRIKFSRSYTLQGLLRLGYYETSVKEEQEAIEKSYFFGTRVLLVSETEIADNPIEEKEDNTAISEPEIVSVEDVTNLDEGMKYMIEHFGIEESKTNTMTKLRNRMKEYNVVFPNLEK